MTFKHGTRQRGRRTYGAPVVGGGADLSARLDFPAALANFSLHPVRVAGTIHIDCARSLDTGGTSVAET
jgi:hypothetical protein